MSCPSKIQRVFNKGEYKSSFFSFKRVICFCLALLGSSPIWSAGNEAFIYEFKQDPKTIGDIKPTFLVYKDRELPDISVEYVLKRYLRLFKNADSPDVKVDTLNRINNLSAKYGLTSKKLTIDKVEQSQAVLDSYEKIVDSGVFYQRMDELLYQTAKAMLFVGNPKESLKRLKLLVGLYPSSTLIDESMFRMAEAYFDLGNYKKAEAQYKKVLTFSTLDTFHQKARFKLGWSAFRLNRFAEAGETAIETLDYYRSLRKAVDFEQLKDFDRDLVEDTLRLLSILFSKQEGSTSIEKLQTAIGHQDYAYLMYDAMFRFYLKQDRFEEGALIASDFSRLYPAHTHSYVMAVNTIRSYKRGEFDINEWNAKEDFVANFGIHSHYLAQSTKEQQSKIREYVSVYLSELAHLYYVRMQQSIESKSDNYQKLAKRAASYYLEITETTPSANENSEYFYLAGQSLAVATEYLAALQAYENAAYGTALHSTSSNAGYAAILTYEDISNQNGLLTQEQRLARRESIERFADNFYSDKRTAPLLNNLANDLYNEKKYEYAEKTSSRVLAYASADNTVLYASWLVNAHSNFEIENYDKAEKSYQKALSFKKDRDRKALQERLAASIYKQAENESNLEKSAALFLRVVSAVPSSSIVSTSLYDASSKYLTAEKWQDAIKTLNIFQAQYPEHKLFDDASDKLVYAYSNSEDYASAARKLLEIEAMSKGSARGENALFQAAELYQQIGLKNESVLLYEQFSQTYINSFDLNLESRERVATHYLSAGNSKVGYQWLQKLVDYEEKYETKRTERSAFLAADASFKLALLQFDDFKKAKLNLPLKKSLKHKKTLLKSTVSSLETVAAYQVAELVSASTFKIGEVYRILAADLLDSQRPTSLNELELEQYNILLEEQAYPFEEQAMDIYRINLAKVPTGGFDQWVKKTYQTLELMNPSEYKRDIKVIPYATHIY